LWQASEGLLERADEPQRAVEVLRLLGGVNDRNPDTYRRLAQAARRAGEWGEAANALSKLAELSTDPEERINALTAEGKIRQRLINDLNGASHAWAQVIQAHPRDIEAIEALVDTVGESRREPMIRDLREGTMKLLGEDPTDPAALRALAQLHRLGNNPDGVMCVLRVLDALGALSNEEQEQLRVCTSQAPSQAQRPLTQQGRELIRHPAETGVVEQLHLLLIPILYKVFAVDGSALKLGRPLKGSDGDLLIERIRRASEVFGISNIVIRRSDEPNVTTRPVQAAEPTIAVGPLPTGRLDPTEVFVLGQAIWHVWTQTAFLVQRTEMEVRALQDAAMKEGTRDYQPSERRLGVEALQREVHRHLPRRSRRPLAEITAQMARLDDATVRGWYHAVKAGADRAGLLLSGSVTASLISLIPGWRGADETQRANSLDRIRSNTPARELLFFAVSKDYLTLRREVGLALQNW